MNISRNPQIAFQQGVKVGKEQGESEGTVQGMNFVYGLLLVCLYNANEDLSKPKLKALYERFSEEVARQTRGYVKGDPGITIADAVDLMCSHDEWVREKLGLPKLDYDNLEGIFGGKQDDKQ